MCGRYYIDTNWLDEIGNVVYSFDIDWKICTEQFQEVSCQQTQHRL